MENNEEVSALTVGGMVKEQKTVFAIPDEELKSYYLKEAVLLAPGYCSANRTEFQLLAILQKEQRRILRFISHLVDGNWERDMSNLHSLSVPYLLQEQVSRKDKQRICTQLTEHIHFLSNLLSDQHVVTELYTLYNRHYANVEYLLKKFPEYKNRRNKTE